MKWLNKICHKENQRVQYYHRITVNWISGSLRCHYKGGDLLKSIKVRCTPETMSEINNKLKKKLE